MDPLLERWKLFSSIRITQLQKFTKDSRNYPRRHGDVSSESRGPVFIRERKMGEIGRFGLVGVVSVGEVLFSFPLSSASYIRD